MTLDTVDEIFEMVTRQYVDVVQDDLLIPNYFTFGPGHIDWQAHIGTVSRLLVPRAPLHPDYEIDVIEAHRPLHEHDPFTPDLFDRWLQIFYDTVDAGWSGPNAAVAKKRATGMARAMAQPDPRSWCMETTRAGEAVNDPDRLRTHFQLSCRWRVR